MSLSISTISKVATTNQKIESATSGLHHENAKLKKGTNQTIEDFSVGLPRKLSEEFVQERLDELNKVLEKQQLETSYQRHEKTNRLVIRLVDKETKEIVKEIPPEKLLDYAAGMDEVLGLFIDKKA